MVLLTLQQEHHQMVERLNSTAIPAAMPVHNTARLLANWPAMDDCTRNTVQGKINCPEVRRAGFWERWPSCDSGDHMTDSHAVTSCMRSSPPRIMLLYSILPPRLVHLAYLPLCVLLWPETSWLLCGQSNCMILSSSFPGMKGNHADYNWFSHQRAHCVYNGLGVSSRNSTFEVWACL